MREGLRDATLIYVLRPQTRSLTDETTVQEETRLSEHFEHLHRVLVDGQLILEAPCLDGEFGVVSLRAAMDETALQFLRSEPVVRHGLGTAELHPFRVSLLGAG